jgi:hypothetical protein
LKKLLRSLLSLQVCPFLQTILTLSPMFLTKVNSEMLILRINHPADSLIYKTINRPFI